VAVRLVQRAWIGVAILVAIVPWLYVVRSVERAQPVEIRAQANSVVWAGRVFTSEAELARWLRSRGASYTAWLATHPDGVATLAHKPAPVEAGRVKHAPRRVAGHASKATAAGRVQHPRTRAAAGGATSEAGRAQYSSHSAVWSSLGHLKRLLLEIVVLLTVAALVVLTLAPEPLVERLRPEWARAASVEVRVGAFALAFSVATGALVVSILG
jgi:hypothetical protein